MTWFGWTLVIWWVFGFSVNLFVAGRGGKLGESLRQSVGSLVFGATMNLIFIILVFTVGTGYGL